MDIIAQIRYKAGLQKKRIALCETDDIRTVKAAAFLADNDLARVILVGSEKAIRQKASSESVVLPNSIEFVKIEKGETLGRYAALLHEKRKHKGMTPEQAEEVAAQPLYFTALMVASGDADGAVAGAVNTTGDVLRAAIQGIGLKEGSGIVSSIFLMSTMDGHVLTFGDCAVVPYPDENQLASIAVDSAATHEALTGQSVSVAMLSFSTRGSAQHERSQMVAQATALAKERQPELNIDGELQFDAAYVASVAKSKAPDSTVAGKANVYVFPNLDAANIGYKITERLAGATATGPVIQGLARPMNDLSRGCNWEDIVNTACVTALMAADQ
ncbi:phosphate acetyltransferase [Balneolales bacterium ANBcel1]|nr:phosphate acetyltransferase [Balneolales bacterium ANBcel1]